MHIARTGTAVILAGLMAACAAGPKPPEAPIAKAPEAAVDRCAQLAKFTFPGVTIKYTKVEQVAAKAPVPAHCLIEGDINPRTGVGGKPYALGFSLVLPADWNGRFYFQGGGGTDGIIRSPYANQSSGPTALARGFAVVANDGGHRGLTSEFMADQQAALDFAHNSVGTLTPIAKQMVTTYYGRAPQHSYAGGCSTGGRESMLAVERHPDFFDGVLVMDPAMETEYSRISAQWSQTVFNRAAPKDASGKPQISKLYSDADRKLVRKRLLEVCDGLDGMKDELIFNYEACRFDPATLICKSKKTDMCLTKTQAEALKTAIAGPKTRGGVQVYPPYPYDTGLIEGRFMPGAPPANAPAGAPTPPANPATEMNVDQAAADAAADGVARLINTANWTNLSTFFGHSGKIIFIHGMSDPTFSALDTVEYYRRLIKSNGGPETVRASSRLFLIPGMLHCQGGAPTVDQYDSLDALVNWVEQGRAPEKIVGAVSNMPEAHRPLCAWPAYANYKGSGDAKDAANYECRQ